MCENKFENSTLQKYHGAKEWEQFFKKIKGAAMNITAAPHRFNKITKLIKKSMSLCSFFFSPHRRPTGYDAWEARQLRR